MNARPTGVRIQKKKTLVVSHQSPRSLDKIEITGGPHPSQGLPSCFRAPKCKLNHASGRSQPHVLGGER